MTNVLRVYNFDIDDNILKASTTISGYKLVSSEYSISDIRTKEDITRLLTLGAIEPKEFSTTEFAEAKNNNVDYYFDFDTAFLNFRDFGKKGAFVFENDMREAIKNGNFAPSWHDFLEAIKSGSLFSFITARGHEPETLKQLARMVIFDDDIDNQGLNGEEFLEMISILRQYHKGTDNEVIEKYLGDCEFMGVSSQTFADKFLNGIQTSPKTPSEFKEMFLTDFFKKCNGIANKHDLKLEYGLSDDDKDNVDAVERLFKLLKILYTDVTFAVYDTSEYKETRYME